MSLEAIKSISAAEAGSQQAIADASAAAKRSVAEAERAAADAIAQARKKAEEETAALLKASDERAAENAAKLRENTSNKCAAMCARAERLLDEAASLIVGRVVES